MLTNGQFSNLKIIVVKGKRLYIVDKHHYALPIWASLSLESKTKYTLISIDYHPDTIRGFNDYAFDVIQKRNPYNCDHDEVEKLCKQEIEKLKTSDFNALIKSLQKLSNDEHICTAYDLGYLKDYHIINCLDTFNEPGSFYYKNDTCYKMCVPAIKTGICNEDCSPHLLKYKMNRLEDNYFIDMGFSIPAKPFILDIDLDYFPTRESLCPQNRNIINGLIQKAEIITIAREKYYFNKCKKDKNFSVKKAEILLIELIKSAL